MEAKTVSQPEAARRPTAPGLGDVPGRPLALWTGATVALLALAGLGLTAVAAGRWWLPPLASVHGAQVDRLLTVILVVIGTVFLLVQAALAYMVIRYGAWPQPRAAHWHEARSLELLWTVIPAVILIVLTLMGRAVWARLNAPPPPGALTVEVTAQQFGWWVRYPGPDGAFGKTDAALTSRANPLGLDAGDPAAADDVVAFGALRVPNQAPVRVLLRSKDVLHSFFVPALRVKWDAVPGRTIEFWFEPTEEGEYEIACAELCGAGHFGMRGVVRVLSPDEFDAWLQEEAGG